MYVEGTGCGSETAVALEAVIEFPVFSRRPVTADWTLSERLALFARRSAHHKLAKVVVHRDA
jgi:hypothetical protein